MKQVLDPGHHYELLTLDGDFVQHLRFVKRCDPEHPEKFPGNENAYPGTTLQSVIRCLIERIDYLQNQIPDKNNVAIREMFLRQLWLLEERAARRHQYSFEYRPEEMADLPMCPHCGHVVCHELGNANHDPHFL